MLYLVMVICGSIVAFAVWQNPPQLLANIATQATRTPRIASAQVVPTTSNPVGNGTKGGRTYANTSFEDSDFACFSLPSGWAYINQDKMRGWLTAHPPWNETNCNVPGNQSNVRIIEIQKSGLQGTNAYEGSKYAELNANWKTFIYQQMCVANGDVVDFTFYHKGINANRADISVFRFGIPTGLPANSNGQPSLSADSYNRPMMYAKTTSGAATRDAISAEYTNFTFGSLYTTPPGTSNPSASVVNAWGKYSGSHTLPSTGWNGVKNLGFAAIDGPSDTGGNFLDGITVGLAPFVDMGTSRDKTALEGASPTAMNIRINGRVTTGTKLALRRKLDNPGPATSDTDFTLGTV
ncbi:MAG: hypothetical protein ACKO83_05640, partial [Roseiflexaceae bacterium]